MKKPEPVDLGPAEPIRRGERIVEETETRLSSNRVQKGHRTRTAHECRLDWYHHRAVLTDAQYAAGMAYRATWQDASLTPRVTASYGWRVPGSLETLSNRVLSAKRRLVWFDGLAGVNVDVVRSVCGLDEWASNRLAGLKAGLSAIAEQLQRVGEARR